MHVRAFIGSFATFGFGVLAACGSSSPTEVIVEPGITAIGQSNELACSGDLRNLQLAIESYTMLNTDPPAAESDLVPDWLRSESELYDLVDSKVVPAAGSGCATVPVDAVAGPPVTTADDDAMGVRQCSARFKTLQVAIEAYYALNGTSVVPTEQALLDEQLLRELDDQHDVDPAGQVVAVPGARCDAVEPPTT